MENKNIYLDNAPAFSLAGILPLVLGFTGDSGLIAIIGAGMLLLGVIFFYLGREERQDEGKVNNNLFGRKE